MKFDDEKIQDLLGDLHSLMWYGDGCPICAHALKAERGKYFQYSCLLGGAINCQPRWRGLEDEKES